MSKKLIIAGGGIGGLTAALALNRAGLDGAAYGRGAAFPEIGAGMSLWPNATRARRWAPGPFRPGSRYPSPSRLHLAIPQLPPSRPSCPFPRALPTSPASRSEEHTSEL